VSRQSPCVMIMAGGTGGHIYPALAVAAQLHRHDIRTVWLGTKHGLENTIVPKHGIKLIRIFVSGLRGRGLLRWLAAPFFIAIAVGQAVIALLKERPGAVLGMGGFASGPGGVAAWLCRIPLIIHEQNARAGTTNRILSRFAMQVFQAFPATFPSDATTVGNPVRSEICNLNKDYLDISAKASFNILLIGGSRGAQYLNEQVPNALAAFFQSHRNTRINVRHQCGGSHREQTLAAYQQAGFEAEVFTFVDDMAAAYQWADVVICRAGAMTISELAAAGIASILVPFPFATDDHQTANAMFLVDAEAAFLVAQGVDFDTRLQAALGKFFRQDGLSTEMGRRAGALAVYDAAEKVSERCRELLDV